MVTTAEVHSRVAAPTVLPRQYGLFSVAAPTSDVAPWGLGFTMEPVGCVFATVWDDACITGSAPMDKTYDDCDEWGTAKPFAVYTGLTRSGGEPPTEVEQKAVNALTLAEEREVERRLYELVMADVGAPTTTSDPAAALAAVEQSLAWGYVGQGVIHLSAAMASLLSTSLVQTGQVLRTLLGTPVVVGAGYGPDPGRAPVTPASGIFATGAVVVRRDTAMSLTTVNRAINDVLSIAERVYAVAWDCFATAAVVTP